MSCASNKSRRLWPRDRKGLTTLETALVLVVFFTLLFGVMDLARYFLTWHGLNTVVSEAAREAMILEPSSPWTYACANPTSGPAATAAASAPFLNTSNLTLCVTTNTTTGTCPQGGQCITISVTASYPFSFMIAPLSAANGTLSAATQLNY